MIITLKKYINNWLDTFTVEDIFTYEIKTAREIFNWDKSYFLKLLYNEKYYIDTDIDFAMPESDKEYTKVYKTPLSQITPIKVKKYRTITKVVPEQITETVYDYIPKTTLKYKMVDDYSRPKYDTIIKKRKIKGKYYWTTEYIQTGKYHKKRAYYEELSYVRKKRTKTRTVYIEKKVKEAYYENVRQRTENDIATKQTKYRYFEPFFIFEYYKESGTTHEHYLYIAPMFESRGNAIVLFADKTEIVNNEELGVFISPQQFVKETDYASAVRKARFMILNGKRNMPPDVFRQARRKIELNEELHTLYLTGTYNQSLDILGMSFFKPADFTNNKKVEII